MTKQPWESAIGERTENPADGDALLAQSKSDRERKRITRQEQIDDAEHAARMAKLAKETVISEAAMEKTGEKKEESSSGGFKITGGMNLGNIDYPAMLQKQIDERDELRKQAEDVAGRQQQISDELRERLHASEMQVLKTSFEAQMQILTKMIEANASKGGFTDQLTAAREIAKELGYERGAPSGGSEMIQIELKKLDFEHQVAMRRMGKEDKAEERRWQLDLRRLDDEREAKTAELALVRERNEMFAKAPEMIGTAVAKGLMASGGETEGVPTPKGVGQAITAAVGEGGEAECVQCHQPVAVGPTARMAVCAGCGAKYPIKRVQAESPGETEEE